MSIEALRNMVHQEVQRVLDRRMRRSPCTVDSYNPSQHAVKVKLQPSGTITGWLEIEQLQTGHNFGIQVAPNIGDPGWVEFHEDDRRAGVFVGASSNDQFPPVPIQAGEVLVKTKWGSSITLKNDGSVTLTDKNSTTLAFDGSGNATVSAQTTVTVTAPIINLGNGGALQPVKLASGAPSTVLKAQ